MEIQTLLCEVFNVSKENLFITISNVSFNEYLSKIQQYVIDKYRGTGLESMSWHGNSDVLFASWSFLFYSRIMNKKLPEIILTDNFTNCKYAIVPVKFHITPTLISDTTLFVKFLNKSNVETYLADAINGKMMNLFHKIPNLSEHIMTYIDSFPNYTDIAETKWDIEKIFNTDDINSPFFIPQNNSHNPLSKSKRISYKLSKSKRISYPTYFVVISYAINGDSIGTHMKNGTDIEEIFEVFPKFYDALLLLGTDYGFLHNDLHLDNILYDKKTKNLVCIDYGRCHFQEFPEDYNKDTMITSELHKANFMTFNDSYSFIMNKINKSLNSSCKINSKYIMCVMDMITLCGNMYIVYLTHTTEFKSEIGKFVKFSYISKTHLHERIISITIYDHTKIYKEYLDFRQKRPQLPKHLQIITEGLFYFALFLSNYYQVKVDDLKNIELNNNHVFYSSFQYILNANYYDKLIKFFKDTINFLLTKPSFVATSYFLQKFKISSRKRTRQSGGLLKTSWIIPKTTSTGSLKKLQKQYRNRDSR